MPSAKLKNYLHLHFIIFIWGFTAVLGKLISIDALPLVWYRMLLAVLLIFLYLGIKGVGLRTSSKTLGIFSIAGILIALHWVTFFQAIKISNVSITLATMSTGAFFTALLEPLWYGRKIIWYELLFGLIVVLGLYLIVQADTTYTDGIYLALVSTLLGAVFTLMNGQLIKVHKPSTITFYELLSGVLVLTIVLAFSGKFNSTHFKLSSSDWFYIFILGSVCTAYALITYVKVMRHISPYSVMLSVNMEPVYGIVLAFLIFGESERMSSQFYLGALIILSTVVANGILKSRKKL